MSVLKPRTLVMDFSRAAIEERDKAAIQQKRLMEAKRMEADKALEKLQGSFEDFKLFKKKEVDNDEQNKGGAASAPLAVTSVDIQKQVNDRLRTLEQALADTKDQNVARDKEISSEFK